jgi:hypothetical protein
MSFSFDAKNNKNGWWVVGGWVLAWDNPAWDKGKRTRRLGDKTYYNTPSSELPLLTTVTFERTASYYIASSKSTKHRDLPPERAHVSGQIA